MLTFQKIKAEDRELFEPYLRKSHFLSCIQSFQTIYLWSEIYGSQYTIVDGWLLVRSGAPEYYSFPFGEGDFREAMDLLLADAHENGRKLRFHGLLREQKELLEQYYPGQFTYTSDRANAEYIYESERLATFAGKKLHAKRNFINRFIAAHPDWRFEPLSPENIPAVRAMHREWARINEGTEEGLHQEGCVVTRCLREFEKLDMVGGALIAEDKVWGFSIASMISDTVADINIEKAFADEPGAYPMVCREMTCLIKEQHPALQFVNREEDTGDEGLRRSKESYDPVMLLEKFVTVEN